MADFDQLMEDIFNVPTKSVDEQMKIEYPHLECALNDLKSGGILVKIEKALAGGYSGMTYIAVCIDSCEYVLKVEKAGRAKANYEAMFASKASKLGIAPKVIAHGVCTNPDDVRYKWMLMHKIEGKTLTQIFPYIVQYIPIVLDQYNTLLNHGIVQYDLKGDNIMVDANKRVYLLDYGTATTFEQAKLRIMERKNTQLTDLQTKMILLYKAGGWLIESLSTKWDITTKEPNKFANYSIDSRRKMFLHMMHIVNSWGRKRFGNKFIVLQYTPKN